MERVFTDEELKIMHDYIKKEIKALNEEKERLNDVYKPQIDYIDTQLREKGTELFKINKDIKERLQQQVIKHIDAGKLGHVTQYDLRKADKNPKADIALQKLAEWWFEYDHTECCNTHCDGECRDCDAHDRHWEEFKNKYHI